MAIALVSGLGNGTSTNVSTTLSYNTNVALAANSFAILSVSTDSIGADGNTNDHLSASGGSGTWEKIYERTGLSSGPSGITLSMWLFQPTADIPLGTTITVTLSAAVQYKAARLIGYSRASDKKIRLATGFDVNPVKRSWTGTGLGPLTLTAAASISRLYYRAFGKKFVTGNLTPTTGFSAIGTIAAGSVVAVGGEYRIRSSTTETSDPGLGTSSDSASIFAALEEYDPAAEVAQGNVSVNWF